MNSQMTTEDWSEYMRALARPVMERDDTLVHTASVSAFLRWVRGIPAPCIAGSPSRSLTGEADALLWSALTDPTIHVDDLVERLAATPRNAADQGAFVAQGLHQAIEVWTECELSSLHALTWLAMEHARPTWARLAETVATWHLQHLQPDNATHHPWAVHLFLHRALTTGDVEARLYGETLLHNCRVATGQPDPLSAVILHDAANALARMNRAWPT